MERSKEVKSKKSAGSLTGKAYTRKCEQAKRNGRFETGRLPYSFRMGMNKGSYFLSSFLGLHFSQVLPAFLASTQHLWVHSLPAALALSQQDSARARLTLPRTASAQTIAVIAFIYTVPFSAGGWPALVDLGPQKARATQPRTVDLSLPGGTIAMSREKTTFFSGA